MAAISFQNCLTVCRVAVADPRRCHQFWCPATDAIHKGWCWTKQWEWIQKYGLKVNWIHVVLLLMANIEGVASIEIRMFPWI